MDSAPGSRADPLASKSGLADLNCSHPSAHTPFVSQYSVGHPSASFGTPSLFARRPSPAPVFPTPSAHHTGSSPQVQSHSLSPAGPLAPGAAAPHFSSSLGVTVPTTSTSQEMPTSRVYASGSQPGRQYIHSQSFSPLHRQHHLPDPLTYTSQPAKRPPSRSLPLPQPLPHQPLTLPQPEQFHSQSFSNVHSRHHNFQNGLDVSKQSRIQSPHHIGEASDQYVISRSMPISSEPFPNSKSLPYPIPHYSQPSTVEHGQRLSFSTPSGTLPGISSRTSSLPSQNVPTGRIGAAPNSFVLYDIAKLRQAGCTILGGKVYNDKGHSICGVLNQHDKPCKRIGKCPFHGNATPVSAANSCNGAVDESGTAVTSSTTPDNTSSPHMPGETRYGEGNGHGGSTSSTLSSRTAAPPKKLQYKHGWTKEEHFLFLHGLDLHGKGSWKQIAAVVKSRTPTQVQSHAQKYFLRQKQNNKNKRSIHDLTMEASEMRELQKRFRNGDLRNMMPSMGLGDNPYVSHGGHTGIRRPRDQDGLGPQQPLHSLNDSFAQNDSLPAGGPDANTSKFGVSGNTIMQRYGPGQAMSATTLGSSMSSGVQIPQINGSYANRTSIQNGRNYLNQQDILGNASQATVSSSQRKLMDGMSAQQRTDGIPQSRDVMLSSLRPVFPQDTYNNNVGHTTTPGPFLSPRLAHFAKPEVTSLPCGVDRSMDGNVASVSGQHSYGPNGFPNLYQSGSGQTVFPQSQQRTNGDSAQVWPYESEVRNRKVKEYGNVGKESIQLQAPFGGMGSLSMPDGFSNVNVSGLANQDQMESSFDAGNNHQSPAFTSAMFGGTEAVDVQEGSNNYVVNGSSHGGNPSVQVRDVGAVINGLSGSNTLPIGGLAARGQGPLSHAPFARH